MRAGAGTGFGWSFALAATRRPLARPKKRSPFHFVPVISFATALSEENRRPSYSKPDSNTWTTMVRPRYSFTITLPGIGSRGSWSDTSPVTVACCIPSACAPFAGTRIRNPASFAIARACCRAEAGRPPSFSVCRRQAIRRRNCSELEEGELGAEHFFVYPLQFVRPHPREPVDDQWLRQSTAHNVQFGVHGTPP